MGSRSEVSLRRLGLVTLGLWACTSDLEQADELFREGRYEEALAQYQKVQGRDAQRAVSGQSAVHYQIGLQAFGASRWAEADKHLQAVIESDQNYREAQGKLNAVYCRLGEEALSSSQWAEAVRCFGLVDSSAGDFSAAQQGISAASYQLALEASARRSWREAIGLFGRVQASDPNYARAQTGLAEAESNSTVYAYTIPDYLMSAALSQNGGMLNSCVETWWRAVGGDATLRGLELRVKVRDRYGNSSEDKLGVVNFTDAETRRLRKYQDNVALLAEEGFSFPGGREAQALGLTQPYERYMGPTARKIYAVIKVSRWHQFW